MSGRQGWHRINVFGLCAVIHSPRRQEETADLDEVSKKHGVYADSLSRIESLKRNFLYSLKHPQKAHQLE